MQSPSKNPGQIKGKMRLDQRLVTMNLAPDLEKARSLIMAGMVVVEQQRQDKPGFMVKVTADIRLKNHPKYVSRGEKNLKVPLKASGSKMNFGTSWFWMPAPPPAVLLIVSCNMVRQKSSL